MKTSLDSGRGIISISKDIFLLPLGLLLTFNVLSAQSVDPKKKTDLVRLVVTVTDYEGRSVPGLGQNDFNVVVDKSQQQISHFEHREVPVSLVFLVDLSGSMKTSNSKISRFQFLSPAIERFQRSSNQANEYSLISFSREASLVVDWTRDQAAILTAFNGLANDTPKGLTAVRNACQMGIEHALKGKYDIRVVVLLSDGQDTTAQTK